MAVQRFILTNKWAGVLPDMDHRLESGSWNFTTQGTTRSLRASGSSPTAQPKPGTEAKEEDRGILGNFMDGTTEQGKYNFELLAEHNMTDDQGNKLFRCDVCGGTYRHAFSLKRHYLRTHINHIYLSSSDISNCNINLSIQEEMDREDFQSKAKKNGLAKVVMTGLYRCNTCLQLFDHLPQLKHHVLNHPSSPSTNRFPCTQCKMTFSHKQNLVRHTSVHSGEKPYTCRYCHKGFPTATNQRRHERIHEGLKPYLCPHCPSHFSQSGDLKKHIRKLHLEFFHPCAFCLKYFSKETDLKEHVVSHGKSLELNSRVLKRKIFNSRMREEVPGVSRLANGLAAKKFFQQGRFRCAICKKRYNSRFHLHQHQRIAHPPSNNQQPTPQSAPPPAPAPPFLPNSKASVVQNFPNAKAAAHSQNGAESNYLFAPCRYFATVSQNIAQNLQDYIDGKLIKKQAPATESNGEPPDGRHGKDGGFVVKDISWSTYNFPPDFPGLEKVNLAKQELRGTDGRGEDSCPNRADVGGDGTDCYDSSRAPEDEDADFAVLDLSVTKAMPVVESQPDKSDPAVLFICHACGERFLSLPDIEDHKVNNHPNVDCTHLEIEGTKNVPVAELLLPRCSPVGVLQRCQVLPPHVTSVVARLRCTKCQEAFHTNAELHEHILLCGGHIEYTNGRKHRTKRKMNRGMKRQLDDDPVQNRRAGPYNTRKLKKDSFDWLLDYQRPVAPYYAPVESDVSLMCDGCNRKFKYSSVLERHQKSCLGNLSTAAPAADDADTIRRQHSCAYCHRSFTYVASLKKHMDDFCPLKYASTKKFKTVTKKPIQGLALKKRLKPKRKKKILKLVKHKIVGKGVAAPVTPLKRPPPSEEKKRAKSPTDNLASAAAAAAVPKSKPKVASPVNQEAVNEPDPDVPEQPTANIAEETEVVVIKSPEPEPESQPEPEPKPVTKEAETPTASKASSDSGKPSVPPVTEAQEQPKESTVKAESESIGKRVETVHTCPKCMRIFTYLANYKKHLNDLCPLRSPGKENTAGLNVKPQQADEEKVDDPPVANNLCNKMTESYVTMLKHRLSHKLNTLVANPHGGSPNAREKDGDAAEACGRSKTNKRRYDWCKGKQQQQQPQPPRGILNRLRRLDVRSSHLAEKRNVMRSKAAAAAASTKACDESDDDKSGSQDDDEDDGDEDYVSSGKSRSGNAVSRPVKSMKTRSETAAKSTQNTRSKSSRLIAKHCNAGQRKAKRATPSASASDDLRAGGADNDL